MDRWGRCDDCARWFYMPVPDACCPVCQAVPRETVDRDEGSTSASLA
jgi:hypothetical protein